MTSTTWSSTATVRIASLELRNGFTNDLTPWLTEHGFTTLPDSHANYVRTTLSLATTLNMAHIDELITPLGPDSRSLRPLDDLLLGPTVPRQFQALGYRYIHIGSWYDATDYDPSARRATTTGTAPPTSSRRCMRQVPGRP